MPLMEYEPTGSLEAVVTGGDTVLGTEADETHMKLSLGLKLIAKCGAHTAPSQATLQSTLQGALQATLQATLLATLQATL